MPLYEYKCVKCGRRSEKIEKLNGPHLKKCPHCGAKVERMASAPAIQFKGSGWYVTDYAHHSASADKKDTESCADSSKSGEKSDTKSDKTTAPHSEKKEEKKEKKKSAAKDK